MTENKTLMGPYLQQFFTEHLCQHRRASAQTIDSCRYTFQLLLRFMHDKIGIAPANLHITDLDAPMVLTFLDYLERERANSIYAVHGINTNVGFRPIMRQLKNNSIRSGCAECRLEFLC